MNYNGIILNTHKNKFHISVLKFFYVTYCHIVFQIDGRVYFAELDNGSEMTNTGEKSEELL